MTIWYFALRFLILDSVIIYLSIDGSYCSNLLSNKSTDLCNLTISAYNLNSAQDQQKFIFIDFAHFIFNILLIPFYIILRKKLIMLKNRLGLIQDISSRFSLMVSNLPQLFYSQKLQYEYHLKETIQKTINNWLLRFKQYQNQNSIGTYLQRHFWKFVYSKNENILNQDAVLNVTLIFDVGEIRSITKLRQHYIQQHGFKQKPYFDIFRKNVILQSGEQQINNLQNSKQFKQQYSQAQNKRQLQKNNDYLNGIYGKLCKQYVCDNKPQFYASKFSGEAIITFRYQHYSQYIKNTQSIYVQNQRKTKQEQPLIYSTYQPDNMNWQQVYFTQRQGINKLKFIYFMIFSLICLSFIALLGLQIWKNKQKDKIYKDNNGNFVTNYSFTMLIAALTFVANYFMTFLITNIISGFNKYSKQFKQITLYFCIGCSQAFNFVIFYNIIHFINPSNILGYGGLVIKVTAAVLINGLVTILLSLRLIDSLIQFFKWCLSCCYKPDRMQYITQINLNVTKQYPIFQFWQKFIFYQSLAAVIFYYGILIPVINLVVIIFCIIQYWVDKYNLLNRSYVPFRTGNNLQRSNFTYYFKRFIFYQLTYQVSYFIWAYQINYDQSIWMMLFKIANFLISFTICVFVWKSLNQFVLLNFRNLWIDGHSYDQYFNQKKIDKTFESQNPLTFCLSKQRQTVKKGLSFKLQQTRPLRFIESEQCEKYLSLINQQKIIDKYSPLHEQLYRFIQQNQNLQNQYCQGQRKYSKYAATWSKWL